jgi:hypothetical protein
MFNLDSKIFRTLKLLFLKPGKLSKEFINGRRSAYIPPVRLYLIGSLIYFTISSFFNEPVQFTEDVNKTSDSTNNIVIFNHADSLQSAILEEDTTDVYEGSGQTFLEENFGKSRINRLNSKEGRQKFNENIMGYIPIGMFFLVPLTALLFYLLFKKNTFYIEHLIFVIHLQTLFYIIFTILNLLEIFIHAEIMEVVTAIIFIFILLAWVKKYYAVKWVKAIWKSALFLLMYSFTYFIFFIIIAAISFAFL